MSSGGGATKVSVSDNAVPKRVVWGSLLCVPQEIPGQGRAPAKFTSNIVITYKYTILNFVPLFLIEQFQRVANFYFIFVSLFELNFFVPVSTAPFNTSLTNGSSNTFMSLCAVIFLEGITVIIEDYARHKSDAVANNTTAHKYDPDIKSFRDAPWRDIEVGDIVRIDSGEKFPGDLLMLCASTAKDGGCGAALSRRRALMGKLTPKLAAPEEVRTFPLCR